MCDNKLLRRCLHITNLLVDTLPVMPMHNQKHLLTQTLNRTICNFTSDLLIIQKKNKQTKNITKISQVSPSFVCIWTNKAMTTAAYPSLSFSTLQNQLQTPFSFFKHPSPGLSQLRGYIQSVFCYAYVIVTGMKINILLTAVSPW